MRERLKKIATRILNLGRFWAPRGVAVFALSLAAQAFAAPSQQVTMKVRMNDSWGPNAVSDLSAVQRPAEGEIRLFWTAPSDYENPPTATPPTVSSYEVRYATFSVASVGGSTTTWWAAAAVASVVPAPSAPGSQEFADITALPAATYYFGIRSRDSRGNVSAVDVNAATPGQQASAAPRSLKPAPVAGLLAFTQPDTSFTVNWNPVVLNEDGTPATDVTGYVVRRSGTLNGPFTTTVSTAVASSNPGFSAAAAPVVEEYLQIAARDAAGNESDPQLSNLLHVTPQGIIGQVATANDGSLTRAYVPSTLMGELKSGTDDLLIRVRANGDPNLNKDPSRTLATYSIEFAAPAAPAVDKNFTFSRPAMNVVLNYAPPAASNPNQSVGVLWWNGTGWIKIGAAEVDPVLRTASFKTGLPGTYQVRQFQAATELTLDKANVFPRIFSPNGDGINDEVNFVIENPKGSDVDGKIYDVGGNEVADIKPAGVAASTWTMAWNGRDRRGSLVTAGVYIYRIKGEGKSLTGTIVVAK